VVQSAKLLRDMHRGYFANVGYTGRKTADLSWRVSRNAKDLLIVD